MSAEPVRRRKNRKTNTSLGIPHTFSFPLLPTHECRAVNLHMMTLTILFHMDVKWSSRPLTGQGRDGIQATAQLLNVKALCPGPVPRDLEFDCRHGGRRELPNTICGERLL